MANEMQKTTPFGMRDKVGYMFGDFANDFTFILSSSFLMKFYTDVMGVSAGVVGMIMMIARFVDAFTDVTMGQIVDLAKQFYGSSFSDETYERAKKTLSDPDSKWLSLIHI